MTDTATEPQAPPQPEAQKVRTNYWGVNLATHKFYLPDGVQWIEFQVMNEGKKANFQKLTNSNLTIDRNQTATVKMDPANERHTLITESVIAWDMDGSDGQPILFDKRTLNSWLNVAPPEIVEDLEMAIRKANPWMQADMKADDIQKEIDRLIDLKKEALEREAGEANSANK